MRHFSFEALKSKDAPPVLISRVGRDIVKLFYEDSVMSVLYRQDATRNVWSTKKLRVTCTGSELNCFVTDFDTGKVTTVIYATTHYKLHFAVGVDAIEAR